MGRKRIEITLHTGYSEQELIKKIGRSVKTDSFSYRIEKKSLDARKKDSITWKLRIIVSSNSLTGEIPDIPALSIPYKKRNKNVTVVGSGPAGFFCAYVLQLSGFKTTIIERGSDVVTRNSGIKEFEKSGIFDLQNNYAFGEGGAGTFSDGKLTSRTKNITREKLFILQTYVQAGAPEEILYMTHPHLGSDNLIRIVKNLRTAYLERGGTIRFGEQANDILLAGDTVLGIQTNVRELSSDTAVFAPGHSASDTYRMLMKKGVSFKTKNFAIGSRVEHPQRLINRAQWGVETLPGVKAAEYRLTYHNETSLPVYTFCMCPGGRIVPAGAFPDLNIVNGMSLYNRSSPFANAACVAGVNLETLLEKEVSAEDALRWVEHLERSFHTYTGNYAAPACSIRDFIGRKDPDLKTATSYPLGLKNAPLWELFPEKIADSLAQALTIFSRKIRGFDSGIILGLESKTSAPVQVIRDTERRCAGFENLYLIGEGSGYSGGIISSAVEGVKTAFQLCETL